MNLLGILSTNLTTGLPDHIMGHHPDFPWDRRTASDFSCCVKIDLFEPVEFLGSSGLFGATIKQLFIFSLCLNMDRFVHSGVTGGGGR